MNESGRRKRQCVQGAMLLLASIGVAQAAELLTLPRAMEQALAANPAIRSQQAELRKQELEKDIARARHLPNADFVGGYTYHAYPSLVTPIREAGVFPPFDRGIANVGIALSLPLYAGGKLVAGEWLAEHNREAAAEALRGAGQDLLFNVVATYTKALHFRDLQKSSRARIATLEAEEAHVAERLTQGRAAKLELIRLQTQLSQARHDLLAIEQRERDALTLLAMLLGESRTLPPLADIAPAHVALPSSLEEALAKAMGQRPELLRAQALGRAASDKLAIARGEQRPQVSLVASAQETAGGDWKGYGAGQIGVQVTIPLFDGSIRDNRVAQARLEQRRSELQVEDTANALASEVEQAVGAVTESRARLEVARQGEREAEEALRIETARYEAGESTITDLLGAESALWAARVNRLQAGYDVTANEARVLRAIGELSPESFGRSQAAAASVSRSGGRGGPGIDIEEYLALHHQAALQRRGMGDAKQQGAAP